MRKFRYYFLWAVFLCLLIRIPAYAADSQSDIRGFVPEEWRQDPEEYADFPSLFEFFSKVIQSVGGETAVEKWEQTVNTEMQMQRSANRDDGLILTALAANALGYTQYNGYDADMKPYDFCFADEVEYDIWSQFVGDYPYVYDMDAEIPLYFADGSQDESIGSGVMPASVFLMLRRMDIVNRVTFLDYYDENYDFRLNEPLTREAAISCMERLISSAVIPEIYTTLYTPLHLKMEEEHNEEYFSSEDSESQKILDNAHMWLDDFQERHSDSASGKQTYYVSMSGNDQLDGKSPESAWATLERALSEPLEEGSCILLERGGIWYASPTEEGGMKACYSLPFGVSIGAYGEGERPQIKGSLEDGSDPENWKLYQEEDGVKIWTFTREIRDANVIVFNDGETWADRILPCRNESGYVDYQGNAFDVRTALSKNLTYCILLDLSEQPMNVSIGDNKFTGPLYLRCDEGNPAEVYNEVAIPQAVNGLTIQENCSVTDICLKYFTCMAVGMEDYDKLSIEGEKIFTNNEIGWCGGMISEYQSRSFLPEGVYGAFAAGGAIQASGGDVSITGNYIHDSGPMANITFIHVDNDQLEYYEYKNTSISNNLFYRCGPAFHWADLTDMDVPGTKGCLTNFSFNHNVVLYSGYGWISGLVWQLDQTQTEGYAMFYSAVENQMGAPENNGIYIQDNTFYLSRGSLITYSDLANNGVDQIEKRAEFSNNIYVQNQELPFAVLNNQPIDSDTFCQEMQDDTSTCRIID